MKKRISTCTLKNNSHFFRVHVFLGGRGSYWDGGGGGGGDGGGGGGGGGGWHLNYN